MPSWLQLVFILAQSTQSCLALSNSDFPFIARWTGKHTDSPKVGVCTASLIAPRWAITARHCAVKLLNDIPNDVRVTLALKLGGPAIKVGVVKAFGAPLKKKGEAIDLALVKLKRPINSIPPVTLDSTRYTGNTRAKKVLRVGTSGKMHWRRAQDATGNAKGQLTVDNTGGSGMIAGDSGGAWLRKDEEGKFVLCGVIHGGSRRGKKRIGIAYQPSHVRAWIDRMTNGTASWSQAEADVAQKYAASRVMWGKAQSWSSSSLLGGGLLAVASVALYSLVFLRMRSQVGTTSRQSHYMCVDGI